MLPLTPTLQPLQLQAAILRSPLTVTPETMARRAIELMSGIRSQCGTQATSQLEEFHLETRSSCVLVVDNDCIVGILTERDVVRLSAQQHSLQDLHVRDVMAQPVITLRESELTDLFFAVNVLQRHRIRHLPLVDEDDRLVGLVTHESLRRVSRPIDLLRLQVVSEVMTRVVIVANANDSMLTIAQTMSTHRVSAIVIVEPLNDAQAIAQLDGPAQRPIGMVTERDLVQFHALGLALEHYTVGSIMSTPIFTVGPEDSLWWVQQCMEEHCIRRLVVTGAFGELLGIVTQTSLLQALNPLEIYKLAKILETKVNQLEAEKVALLESRTAELEQQVETRTIELKTKAYQEQLFASLAMQIRSSLSLPKILATTVEQVRQVLGCDRVTIWQFEAAHSLVVAESTILTTPLLGEWVAGDCCQGPQAESYRQGQIRIIPDLDQVPASDCHRDTLLRLKIRAAILVPLLCGNELWGLLSVSESQRSRHWQSAEVSLLQGLAMQLAIALQQAITHEQLQAELQARQTTEARLRESEQRYATLVTAAPVGIFRTDLTGSCIYVNDRYCQMIGREPGSLLGEGWQQALHPDDLDLVTAEWRRSVQEQRPFQLEYRVQQPDGHALWVYGQSLPERDASGQTIGYVGTLTDISARKQAELSLQTLVEGTAATTGRTFFPALVRYVSAALQVPYVVVTELVGNQLEVLSFWADGSLQVHPPYNLADTPCERTLQLGVFYCHSGVQDLFPKDHALIELSANSYFGVNLQSANGEAIGNLCILDRQPIQDSQRAETLLRVFAARAGAELERQRAMTLLEQMNQSLEIKVQERTEELWTVNSLQRAILNSTGYSIISTNLTGTIEVFNAAAERMLGYTAAEMVGKSTPECLHDPQEVADCAASLSQRFGREIPPGFEVFVIEARDGHTSEQEWTYIRKDGSRFPVWLSVTALYGHQQNIIGFVGIAQDITQRKQSEARLRDQEQFLRSIYDGVDYPIFVIDVLGDDEFVYIDWNAAAERASGMSADDIVGTSPESMHGSDSATACQYLRECLRSGESVTYEEWMDFAGEERTWWLTTLNPLRNSRGNVYRIVGTSLNITDRKQAEQTIRHQIDREQLLREITQRIRQSLDLQTIFETACHEIRAVIQSDRVGIFRLHPESSFTDGVFVAESVDSRFISVVSVSVSDHCFGTHYANLYAQGKFYVIDDIYNGNLRQCHTDILAQFQVRSTMVMPLLCGKELWGLLCIHQCSAPRQWHEFETDLMIQISTQLGIAIQQANLYEKIQSELLVRKQTEAKIALQLRRQETLGAIIQKIRESLNINEILTTVTEQVREVLHCDRVIIFRLYPDGTSRIVEESLVGDLVHLKDRHWENEVWAQEILDIYWQGKPRIVPDVMRDVWTDCLLDYSIEGQIQSKIVAPILQDVNRIEQNRWVAPSKVNQLWGVLVVHACHERRIWQNSEAQLLQQIANQLSIAIQQSYLFEQLQQELTERQETQRQLTERNQELAISNQELARATRLKDEFLANMSHELRTPLNAILGMAEGLQDEAFGVVNDQQIKALQTIGRSGSHLLELINDILDVAKIESGQIELEYATVSIAYLCQSSLSFIRQQALKKSLQIETQTPAILPDLVADERRLRQVLINLLNNAVKFTPEGGKITLRLEYQPCNQGEQTIRPSSNSDPEISVFEAQIVGNQATHPAVQGYLQISVIDTGIGISEQNIQKLFRPFIQIDSALNRQYSGTGLGLVLVKQIVELHGGYVDVNSQLGSGSCFSIHLPCSAGSQLVATSVTINHSSTNSQTNEIITHQAQSEQFPLVLLAEDNEANISTVSSYLKAKGYRILLAKHGQEAITMARQHHPDLILMDIQMPGMDGLEATKQIRQDSELADTPIVALTALAMPGDRERCLAAGANDYISKPVKLKQLVTVMQQLLMNRG